MNRFTKDYVYSSLKENTKTRELVETYDLEIDCETHSFIANNTIVHNSVRYYTKTDWCRLSSIISCYGMC